MPKIKEREMVLKKKKRHLDKKNVKVNFSNQFDRGIIIPTPVHRKWFLKLG